MAEERMAEDHTVANNQSGDRLQFLGWLIDYEIRGSERYRRFVSILWVLADHSQHDLNLLYGTFRGSDEIVPLDDNQTAVLLRETDVSGTLSAIDRFKALYVNMGQLKFAVASYPNDGWNSNLLLDSVQDRIKQAEDGPNGMIVS